MKVACEKQPQIRPEVFEILFSKRQRGNEFVGIAFEFATSKPQEDIMIVVEN